MDLPLLIYDGDCGFCTRSARLLERWGLAAAMHPWQEVNFARLSRPGASAERAMHEVLWVNKAGRVFGGGQAMAMALRHCQLPFRALGHLLWLPGLRALTSSAYRLVAANRFRLPGSTPACQLPPGERPGFRRADAGPR